MIISFCAEIPTIRDSKLRDIDDNDENDDISEFG